MVTVDIGPIGQLTMTTSSAAPPLTVPVLEPALTYAVGLPGILVPAAARPAYCFGVPHAPTIAIN